MTTKIEQVAQVLAEAMAEKLKFNGQPVVLPPEAYECFAIAAIAALEIPTEAMIGAGFRECYEWLVDGNGDEGFKPTPKNCYQAMIRTALEE